MGTDFSPWDGRLVRIGRGLYLGDGIDGLHSFVRTIGLACQRTDAGHVSLGIYAVAGLCRQNGHHQYDRLLGGGILSILGVPAWAATGLA